MVRILEAQVAALSILNSSGASPGATKKVAALVARASCSGATHCSAYNSSNNTIIHFIETRLQNTIDTVIKKTDCMVNRLASNLVISNQAHWVAWPIGQEKILK